LIKTQRANLITSAADLVYLLNWELPTTLKKEQKAIQKQLFVSLTAEEQSIYEYLQKTGKEAIDIIALNCNIPIYRLSSLLLNMELKGVIRPLPGKIFEAV
jgi:DNA processing protein